jgi:hypothetical protein
LYWVGELLEKIIPYSDSLGMNEQELPNLHSMLTTGGKVHLLPRLLEHVHLPAAALSLLSVSVAISMLNTDGINMEVFNIWWFADF